METDARSATSVLILAGGRGQRMGGRDKGLISWRGKPLIQWLCDAARPVTDDLLISCNRNHDAYAEHADRLVCDDDDTFPGPLAGIRAGLAAARHARLLVLPCDTPLIDSSPTSHSCCASAANWSRCSASFQNAWRRHLSDPGNRVCAAPAKYSWLSPARSWTWTTRIHV